VQHEIIAATAQGASGHVSFSTVSKIVEEIGERYGKWQNAECVDLKGALMQMENQGTGRVLLKDFYGNALGGAWQFSESEDYLRELGALDESDAKRKAVIISNYVYAPSNCLASSGMYGICCLNECEGLLGHIEREVGSPEATPEQILALTAKLPSSTVQAPRNLSQSLLRRLDEIGEASNGDIPLHNRLFAQWMHQAFPRECPYPHLVGTTTSLGPKAWSEHSGLDFRIDTQGASTRMTVLNSTIEQLERDFSAGQSFGETRPEDEDLMWSTEEETFIVPSRSLLERIAYVAGFHRSVVVVLPVFVAMAAFVVKMNPVQDGKDKCCKSDAVFV
jgi:hypothetical protein